MVRKLKQWFGRNPTSPQGLVCVAVEPDGIAIVQLLRKGDNAPSLIAQEWRPAPDPETKVQTLRALARHYRLGKLRCTTLLAPSAYKLIVTEPPDVPPEERVQALRWRIKDLIDFPAQNATLDVVELPAPKNTATVPPVYVVAARSEAVKERVDLMAAAGINLQVIDIPEMALRNIAVLLPQDAQGLALVWIHGSGGTLTVTRQGTLYLTRVLTSVGPGFGWNEQVTIEHLNALTLELQRSLDYCEHQHREGAIHHIAVLTATPAAAAIALGLSQGTGVPAEVLDLAALLGLDAPLAADWHSHYLTAIGAALRQEVA